MRCRACDTVWIVAGPPAEDEPPESETLARVVRRGDPREERDLFARPPSDPGTVRDSARPAPEPTEPPTRAAGIVAARNETSVLFTLAGLTGTARLKTPEPERTPMTTPQPLEDDGIIDLKALASVPPRPGAVPVMPLFGSEPPPAAFARDAGSASDHVAAQPNAKRMAAVLGVLAAVVVAGVGLAFVFRGEKPAPVATVAAPAPPPPPAVVAPPPQPEPAPVAAATEDTSAKPATPAKAGKGAKGNKWKGAKGKARASEGAAAPKAARGSSDPCGCHGDFNCVLACTVKKGK